jgi:hypothetical protein
MSQSIRLRGAMRCGVAVAMLGVLGQGCLDRPVAAPDTRLQSGVSLAIQNNAVDSVDILFEVDNSNSMAANQANLARNFATVLINQLVSPPDRNMDGTAGLPPGEELHVGVISSDLGTPGSTVPSCANSDIGDDGLLNPIRNGQAIRSHQPWTTAPAGTRPARCTTDPNQYPSFLDLRRGDHQPGGVSRRLRLQRLPLHGRLRPRAAARSGVPRAGGPQPARAGRATRTPTRASCATTPCSPS